MGYTDYAAPGVSVFLERANTDEQTPNTEFFPVFIGTGMTSLSKNVDFTTVTPSVSNSKYSFSLDVTGNISSSLYTLTDATLSKIIYNASTSKSYDVTPFRSGITVSVSDAGKVNITEEFSGTPTTTVFPSTTLSAALTSSGTTIALTSTASVTTGTYLQIDNEIVKVTTGSSIERGKFGTQPADHNSGGTVTILPIASFTGTVAAGTTTFTVSGNADAMGGVKSCQTFYLIKGDSDLYSSSEQVRIVSITASSNDYAIVVDRNIAAGTAVTSSSSETFYFIRDNGTMWSKPTFSASPGFDVTVALENTTDDYEPRLFQANDRFNLNTILGPYMLTEGSNIIRNDIAFAAEIALRSGVQGFYYLEVPRDYGSSANASRFNDEILDKLYFKKNIYRIVPLISDNTVSVKVKDFVEGISNPLDKRETVAYVSVDLSQYNSADLNDITKLSDVTDSASVAALSASLNSERVMNVFGAKTVSMSVGSSRTIHQLPEYFLNVAVASLDAALPLSSSLSMREIPVATTTNQLSGVFVSAESPRFRPAQWNQLAKNGVFIIQKDDAADPFVIRHQLTTAQSDDVIQQEYSIVKTIDVVSKRIRDGFNPYVGKYTIDSTLYEKLNATLGIVTADLVNEGVCREITPLSSWTTKLYTGSDAVDERRILTINLQIVPSYPANNLEINLVI